MRLRSWLRLLIVATAMYVASTSGCGMEGTHNGSRPDKASTAGPPNEPSRYDAPNSPGGGPSGGATPAAVEAPGRADGATRPNP